MVTITASERFTTYAPVVPTTAFPVGFPIFDPDDVKLLLNGVDYPAITVSATFVEGVSTDAVINVVGGGLTGNVIVLGDRDPRRTDQYQDGRPLKIEDHNYSLNRLTIESQEHHRDVGRSLKVPVGSATNTDLPAPEAGKVLGWNDTATGLTNKSAIAFGLGGAAGVAIFQMDLPETVRDYLDVMPLAANRTALKALNPTKDTSAFLWNEGGRSGLFYPRLISSLSAGVQALVAADAVREGIYVISTQNPLYVWVRSYSGWAFAKWWGDDQTAVVQANAIAKDIAIDQNFPITASATFPRGVRYKFFENGAFTVSAAQVLTIKGKVKAPNIQIFFGSGTVISLRWVRPEWWGAVGNGVTDDKPACQLAATCLETSLDSDGDRQTFQCAGGAVYGLKSTLIFRPMDLNALQLIGVSAVFGSSIGSQFKTLAPFTGVEAILVDGQTVAQRAIADWKFKDFGVVNGTNTSIGISIGANGKNLIGLQQNLVENVNITGFATGWKVMNTRLVNFDRCSVWAENIQNAVGWLITVGTGGTDFTGDINLNQCQAVVTRGLGGGVSRGLVILNTSGATNYIAGMRLNNFIPYHADLQIQMASNGGANIMDIWIKDNQWDGVATAGIDLTATNANSKILNIKMTGNYLQGFTGNALTTQATAGGLVESIEFSNNWMNGFTSFGVLLQGNTKCVNINENIFHDFNIGAALGSSPIRVVLCQDLNIIGNQLKRTGAGSCYSLVGIDANVSNNIVAIGNNSAGFGVTSGSCVVNGSTGATFAIANNI